LVGAAGFEPTGGGIKNRCLTTWLRPIRLGKTIIIFLMTILRMPFLKLLQFQVKIMFDNLLEKPII
jgi:hypothetical protein